MIRFAKNAIDIWKKCDINCQEIFLVHFSWIYGFSKKYLTLDCLTVFINHTINFMQLIKKFRHEIEYLHSKFKKSVYLG